MSGSKIWTKFYRDSGAEYSGSGLGLSIVAQILSMQNLPYGAENQTGGVRFSIRSRPATVSTSSTKSNREMFRLAAPLSSADKSSSVTIKSFQTGGVRFYFSIPVKE